jgi:menaquinone-specific isochorismate synthase
MTRYNALWSRPGLTIAGIGRAQSIDPGTGPHRYQRAQRALEESGRAVGFASFTFDPAQSGSLVVIPEDTTGDFDIAPVMPGGHLEHGEDQGWREIVDRGLAAIESGHLSKVVLARHLSAQLNTAPDPFAIAASLLEQQAGCHIFVVDNLVGASPELLLSLDTGILRSTPLAGSSMSDDAELSSSKMTEEHLIAADSVADALILSGVTFEREVSEVLNVGSIKHLATRFTGKVETGTSFADLLPQMHPTAAVAGTPRPAAMNLIRRLEGNTRGRYSGPVGWFDIEGNCEFALALRCGLVSGDKVTLHSGAGIVAESEPGAELEETRWKLQPMIDALGLES